MSAPVDLGSKRLVVVMGKGGVGRTTCATALALALARRGRRTLLYQASAKEKVSRLLGARTQVGQDIVEIRDNLFAVNTNPTASIHQYGLMVLRYESVYRLVMENAVVKRLIRAIPGVDDYSIVGKMWWHTTEEDDTGPRWPTVVFDAPATGHALSMLKTPRAILDAVPEGPLTHDAAKIRALLEDSGRTAVVLVSLAEEMPVAETIELARRVERELAMPITHLVVNQLYPGRFFGSSIPTRVLDAVLAAGRATNDELLSPLIARARTLRARRQLNERYLARLEAELGRLRRVSLPMIFSSSFGAEELSRLAEILEAELQGGRTLML